MPVSDGCSCGRRADVGQIIAQTLRLAAEVTKSQLCWGGLLQTGGSKAQRDYHKLRTGLHGCLTCNNKQWSCC